MALNPADSLTGRLLQIVTAEQLCKPDDCLIIGVSGGADSIALLDLLTTLPGFPLRLIVAHLNHCLRGAESDADEAFVRQQAAVYGLICEVRKEDVLKIAASDGCSVEEAGRTARYQFFEELRKQYQANSIAVAHHQDDQAETFLLRLLRGSGTSGLGGMQRRTQNHIIRPLLDFSRAELLNYLSSKGLQFREDQSNLDQTYLRNRIRHQLLPLLTDYNPAMSGQLAATADLLKEDEALLADYTLSHFQKLASSGPGWVALPRNELLALRSGLRTRLYRMAIAQIQGDLRRIERKHLFQLDDCLIEGSTGSSRNLPNRLVGLLTTQNLLIGLEQHLYPAPPCTLTITDCGRYDLGNGLSLQIEPAATAPSSWNDLPKTTTYIDLQQAPFPWQVRPHNAGERFEPSGMTGSRKIQDILTDKKTPRNLRPALPLLCCNNQPLWLAGVCRSGKALLKTESAYILKTRLIGADQLLYS